MPTRARPESNAAGSAGDQTSDAGTASPTGFQVPLPGMGSVDPLRLLWLGGLAALATVEIIEWPVALALGAGSYIAERLARQDILQDLSART